MIKWKLEQRKLSELKPYPFNPRKRNDEGFLQLEKSIEEIGLAAVPNITRDNTILSGHQRVALLKEKHGAAFVIDVFVADRDLNEQEMRDVVIWLNKAIAGDWDTKFIDENFDELGFEKYGFEGPKRKGDKPEDAVPDAPEPIVQLGDIWQLGEHRIMCGDANNLPHVTQLMNGRKADMIFTDPPYNVAYADSKGGTIQNDDQDPAAFRVFLTRAFESYRVAAKPNAPMYCCYASRTHREFEDAMNVNNWEVRNQIIWVKLVATMSWGDYRWKHEPILYAHQKGQPVDFYGDRKQYTEWTQEKTDEELLAFVKDMISKEEKGQSTIWRFNRESSYKHPTQKPVELIGHAIINSSRAGELVMDLFLGSGSTLLASEKHRRICYGMELEPKFCDVIIKRWEEFTGKKAVKQLS